MKRTTVVNTRPVSPDGRRHQVTRLDHALPGLEQGEGAERDKAPMPHCYWRFSPLDGRQGCEGKNWAVSIAPQEQGAICGQSS